MKRIFTGSVTLIRAYKHSFLTMVPWQEDWKRNPMRDLPETGSSPNGYQNNFSCRKCGNNFSVSSLGQLILSPSCPKCGSYEVNRKDY